MTIERLIVPMHPGLIDIHCHLLPGLDDGPATLEASEQMSRVAQAAGTVALVATPHANHRFPYDPARTAQACAQLRRRIPRGFQLFTGCELQVNVETLFSMDPNLRASTLNGSRYLLLELMRLGMPPNLGRVWANFLESGVTPVLAHPERTAHLTPETVRAWVEQGCLIQVTGDALTGRMGGRMQSAAMELIRRRLVHFVASDGHDPYRRPPRLTEAYRMVRRISTALAELLFITNPRAVLEDAFIQAWPAS